MKQLIALLALACMLLPGYSQIVRSGGSGGATNRTVSTNSIGTVRRFLVAQTPETDLESPLLLANASAAVQAGYVYLGYQPLMRFDSGGNPVYYLEDAMGTIAALADGSGAKIASFNYDGFGNYRSVSGSTNAPSGTVGDFRFQGCWLEEGSGLYNMRAREYDARLGRFTGRDPDHGDIEGSESLHTYAFADSNPYVYSDRSGEFTVIELNIVGFLQFTLQTLRGVALNEAKSYASGKLYDAFGRHVISYMSTYIFGFDFGRFDKYLSFDPLWTGSVFDRAVWSAICFVAKQADPGLADQIHHNVQVVNSGSRVGDPVSAGRNCNGRNQRVLGQRRRARYSIPDLIFGPAPLVRPGGPGGIRQTFLIAEVKSQATTMYGAYISPGRQSKQLDAILGYSFKHTETHIAAFIIAKNDMKRGFKNQLKFYYMKRIIGLRALSHSVIPVVVNIF